MTYFEYDRNDPEPVRERWWLILRVDFPEGILVVRLNAKLFPRRKSPKPTPYFEYNG
jgi:hypothetical protein